MDIGYKHMFWLIFVLFCTMSFLQYEWKKSYYLAKSNEIELLKLVIKQDSIRATQQDTINVLRFKLQTLKND